MKSGPPAALGSCNTKARWSHSPSCCGRRTRAPHRAKERGLSLVELLVQLSESEGPISAWQPIRAIPLERRPGRWSRNFRWPVLGRERARDPRGSARDDGVDIDQQFPGAGDAHDFMQLSGGEEPVLERNERRVPMISCRQDCVVEAFAQALTAACDVLLAVAPAALVVIGGEAGKRRHLLA